MFAFRLHEFLSSGGSVYATLEAPNVRSFSSEGPFYAPREAGKADNRVMYPLAFCRECGQEHYLCSLAPGKDGIELLPRSPLLHITDEDLPGDPGFITLEDGSLWSEDEDLPDNFVEMRRNGPRVKTHYQAHVPRRIWVTADGKASRDTKSPVRLLPGGNRGHSCCAFAAVLPMICARVTFASW